MTCKRYVSIDESTGKYSEDTFKALAPSCSNHALLGVDYAEVIAAALITQAVTAIWSNLAGGTNRACVMGMTNATDKTLFYGGMYLWSGQVTTHPAAELPSGHGAVPLFQHTAATWRGSVGVVGYHYGNGGPLIAVLWSVPYSGTSYMNARIYPATTPVDYNMAYNMYYEYHDTGVPDKSKCVPAGGQPLSTNISGFAIQATLTAENDARMNIWMGLSS